MTTQFPAANYYIAASRLRPGLDGGYTVATLERARNLAACGVQPQLLTFDTPPMDDVLPGFIGLGLADENTRLRNLFQEARQRPDWLARACLDAAPARPPSARVTTIDDADGRPLLELPYVDGADWHRSTEPITVFEPDGSPAGALPGFGALYRAWVDAVVAERPGPAVVIVEAKQVGELLGPHPRAYALIHTVHNNHTLDPFQWDSPMDTLWEGWFAQADSFDAVLWLTQAQKADAERRFGPHPEWLVVPHPAEPPATTGHRTRDPNLAVMLARLSYQKRVDHALRAFALAVEAHPQAAWRLEIRGNGPERASLVALADQLGIADRVAFRGYVPDASADLEGVGLVCLSSRYEGQPLTVLEALQAGTPVVSYDVNYGPSEMIEDGVSGRLVPNGDVEGLAAALAGLLGAPARIEQYGAAARRWAQAHGPQWSMALTRDAVEYALAHRKLLAEV